MKRVLQIGVFNIVSLLFGSLGFTLAGVPLQAAPPDTFAAAGLSSGARYQLASWRDGDDQYRGDERGRDYDRNYDRDRHDSRDRQDWRDRDRNNGYGDNGYYRRNDHSDERYYRNGYYRDGYYDRGSYGDGYYDRDRHAGRSAAIIVGGAGAGAAIGAAAGHGQGAAIGAVVGGIAGIIADQAVRHHDHR